MAILKFKNANNEWEVAETPGAVKYTEQTLTDAQKAQARANIGVGNIPAKISDLENDNNFITNLTIGTNLRGKTVHIRSLVEKDDSGIIVFRAGDAYIENSAYYDSYSDDNTGGWFGGQEPWEKYEFDAIVNFPDDKDYTVSVYDTNYIKAAIVYTGIEVEGGIGQHLVLVSPDGTKYALNVDDSGNLSTVLVT